MRLAEVASVLDELGAGRVFLVTGRGSFAGSGARDALAPALRDREVASFVDFEVNPKVEDVERGVAALRAHRAEVVVAVGGGSVLDIAKLISICAANDGPVRDHVTGARPFAAAGVPVIAIPTTAGSGAEATHFAVCYVDGDKYSVTDERMRPAHAVLEPSLTTSMPPALTASTGVDALSQAIESLWSTRSTDESRGYARDAARLAIANLPGAVAAPTPEVRAAMMQAAHLAGKAIDIARTTAPHALSYKLTTGWGVPHGHAVGLTLGGVFDYNRGVVAGDVNDARGAAFVQDRMRELDELLGPAASDLRGFIAGLGLETRLRALGVTRADLPAIAGAVNHERLRNNPRRLSPEAIGRILEDIY